MALGGYKFAGYKCTKGESMTDAEWALLIHKTRIKAFLEANTSANAGWVFDLNGGTIDFNATYTGVIYDLGGDGLNLVSYFRNGAGDNAKYYMIASLFNWTCGTPTSSQIQISNTGPIATGPFTSSGGYKVGSYSLFHAVSYDPFPEDCLLKSANNYPSRAISLVPICGFYQQGAQTPSCTPSTNDTYFKTDKMYFGYALKDLDIIHLSIFNDNLSSANMYRYIRTSLLGFNSFTLSSPNDSSNIYGVCLSATGPSELDAATWTNSAVSYCNETLTDSFTRYVVSNKDSHLTLTGSKKALFNGVVTAYPFETVSLTTNGVRTNAPFLNSDGIVSKGTFNIELLSCNGSYNNSAFSEWNSVANGNYLTVLVRRAISTIDSTQTTYYVGWDASNPNILDETSWTEFSE